MRGAVAAAAVYLDSTRARFVIYSPEILLSISSILNNHIQSHFLVEITKETGQFDLV